MHGSAQVYAAVGETVRLAAAFSVVYNGSHIDVILRIYGPEVTLLPSLYGVLPCTLPHASLWRNRVNGEALVQEISSVRNRQGSRGEWKWSCSTVLYFRHCIQHSSLCSMHDSNGGGGML